MKLIPKAKPIRIRIVSGGEEHSSIETLRKNYSLKDILPLIKDGRLHKWLLRVGETKAAEAANILKDKNINDNPSELVNLTALIFNSNAESIDELQQLWVSKYPRSFLNYVKEYEGNLMDISSVHQLYNSINGDSSEITENDWRNIFVTTLKNMPLSDVLEDFKKFKSTKPMNEKSWKEVLTYHSTSISDKELYLIAQAAYDNPYLKDEAIKWYQKSARSYIKAKEWINKNIERLNSKELFDTFEKDPTNFNERFFNSTYPQDLVRFLNVISQLYTLNQRPQSGDYSCNKYNKYVYIVNCLFDLTYWKHKTRCINGLKRLPTKNYFPNYVTLDKIINSLETKEPIFGVRLWDLNYQNALLFIVGLAKIELENEK